MTLEREAREKALGKLPGMWTVSASTLFDTRTASLESKLETATIPRAFEPLRTEVNALSESCEQSVVELKAVVAEAQQKLRRDYDRTVKETQLKVDASNAASAKEILRLEDIITGLRQDLVIERVERAELEKSYARADVSRAEDMQQMLDAVEALKVGFVTKFKEMEIIRKEAL